jgi:hypothetical protein
MKTLMVVTLLTVMTAGCSRKQSQPPVQAQLPEDERVKQQEAIRRFEQWTVQPGSGKNLTP